MSRKLRDDPWQDALQVAPEVLAVRLCGLRFWVAELLLENQHLRVGLCDSAIRTLLDDGAAAYHRELRFQSSRSGRRHGTTPS